MADTNYTFFTLLHNLCRPGQNFMTLAHAFDEVEDPNDPHVEHLSSLLLNHIAEQAIEHGDRSADARTYRRLYQFSALDMPAHGNFNRMMLTMATLRGFAKQVKTPDVYIDTIDGHTAASIRAATPHPKKLIHAHVSNIASTIRDINCSLQTLPENAPALQELGRRATEAADHRGWQIHGTLRNYGELENTLNLTVRPIHPEDETSRSDVIGYLRATASWVNPDITLLFS